MPRRTQTFCTPTSCSRRAARAIATRVWGTVSPTMADSSSRLGVSASTGRCGESRCASGRALATLTGSSTTGTSTAAAKSSSQAAGASGMLPSRTSSVAWLSRSREAISWRTVSRSVARMFDTATTSSPLESSTAR